jgi:3-(3-hydroxy-phenyl)propionate hydroxylase
MMSLSTEPLDRSLDTDVIVVGGGPAGLMTANLLAGYSVRVIVVEADAGLIDYPRGVGLDDEALRAFQAAGLVDEVLPHTIPHQVLAFIDSKGSDLARIAPPMADFGWPRRNGFVQPFVDRVLLDGLSRFEHADILWSTRVTGLRQDDAGVTVAVSLATGGTYDLRAAYAVGADGGRSTTRKALGIEFPGSTARAEWLVIDIRNDPLGRPGAYVGADPKRPYASIGLPHGIRRFEFMMLPGESAEDAEDAEFIADLLERFIPRGSRVDIIRRRVYTHQSRLADRFRSGRVLLVGDAAHLMPVWQGQGYNSGIRDAFNLAWKLATVVKGLASDRLLDTYDLERRDHVRAMIRLSTWVGRVISVRSRLGAFARDVLFKSLSLIPRLQRYVVQMRFKPMPTIRAGAVTSVGSPGPESPVGRLFPQPFVVTRESGTVRLDDAIGDWLTLLAWNNDPAAILDADVIEAARRASIQLVEARPAEQLHWLSTGSHPVLGDAHGALRAWFDARPESVVLIRPDRIVGGAAPAHAASAMLRAFLDTAGQSPIRKAAE